YNNAITEILEAWFVEHMDDPYPTDEQKTSLAKTVGLTYQQISTWFNNNRRR
ncbi:unnamed protein product, partial [Choristocarpus tenellus]